MTNDTTENLHEAAAKGHTETFIEKLDKRIADFEKIINSKTHGLSMISHRTILFT